MKLNLAALAVAVSVLTAVDSHAYTVAGWIPPWNGSALTSLQQNAGAMHEANPVWYGLGADGSITKNWNAENATWRAAMAGLQILPTIQNVAGGRFDPSLVVNLIATSEGRERHAEAIAQLVAVNAYDGIDIDYERVPTTSRSDFTAFVTRLAGKLHAAGKKLSVTVYAKTSDQQNWNGPGSQDWAAIGAAADSVKIMAYDYSWSTSAPGPIAPLAWIDSVAAYAESVIPASKIIMGLPFYGYDWDGTIGRGIDYAQAMSLAATHGATISRDPNGEPTFAYSGHTVYFQDATSYAKKIETLRQKHPSIGGFTHWAQGQEDPAIWNVIRSGANSGTSPATPVPAADFQIDGPAAVSVMQGRSLAAEYRMIAINGFSGVATVSVQAPGGLTATPSASTVSPASPVTLTIGVSRKTAPGTHAVTVRFTSGGGIVRELTTGVVVQPAPKGKTHSAGR
ncbi:MAG TPA: glycosyl hydrolase family 18 protein [Thermoanaerobaculia bacterium]|nr:glycosyl hydrolase family 18 protein [Thermoanaerobaculia bacterium]